MTTHRNTETQMSAQQGLYALQSCDMDGARVQWIGRVHDTKPTANALAAAFLSQGILHDRRALQDAARALHGYFSCIIRDRTDRIFACVDKIQSYPLVYRMTKDGIRIGLHPEDVVAGGLDAQTVQRDAVREFAMTGYVTGRETLITDVFQLQAGEFLDAQGRDVHIAAYYQFFQPPTQQSWDEMREELADVTIRIFRELVERLRGRPVFVPLSMGLDSRLVVSMLRHLGHDRIETFSYGRPGNCEAMAARCVAERLGVPWRFVPYTRALGRAFHEPACQEYLRFAHRGISVPSMLDIHAMRILVEGKMIPADAVLINGQSGDLVTGGHVPASFDAEWVTRDELVDAIARRHYGLWAFLLQDGGAAFARQRIIQALGDVPSIMSGDDAMRHYERWEWRIRQSKYVVAGQRSYEFFGLQWELPLWDDAYLDFWARIPIAAKRHQALYREYLESGHVSRMFRGVVFPEYVQPYALRIVSRAFSVFGNRRVVYRRRYLHYWQEYAHQYAMIPFREYRRFAETHRNPVSFFVRHLLRDRYGVELDERVGVVVRERAPVTSPTGAV